MTKGRLSAVGASLAVAVGLFAARVLIWPPVTIAAPDKSIQTHQLTLSTGKDLPSFDNTYQRHLGVLDTLNTP